MAQIRRVKDPNNLTEAEQKHIPVLETLGPGERMEVKVSVGRMTHPMLEEHYIEWIELYKQNGLIGKTSLKPDGSPEARFTVDLSEGDILRAVESCTLHGLWEEIKKI